MNFLFGLILGLTVGLIAGAWLTAPPAKKQPRAVAERLRHLMN